MGIEEAHSQEVEVKKTWNIWILKPIELLSVDGQPDLLNPHGDGEPALTAKQIKNPLHEGGEDWIVIDGIGLGKTVGAMIALRKNGKISLVES